nr:class I adenylate-forming enzyme family protein [Lysinibacillus timonensis]
MNFYTNVLEGISKDNISLSTFNTEHTAGELRELVSKYEEMLGHSNLEGKKVAILVDSIKNYIALFHAINKLNGTVVPLSLQFKSDDLTKVLNSLDPHIIFSVNVSVGFHFSGIMCQWANNFETKTTIFTTDDFITWDEHSFGSSTKNLSKLSGGYITFTSGSTGEPKGIVCEDGGFDYTCRCLAEAYELKPSDNMFIYSATSSFYWVVSSNTVLKAGANLVVSDEFDLLKIIDTMEKTNCNKFSTTPSIFKSIYNFASKIKPEVLKNLELVCVVGEKISPNFANSFPLMEKCKFVSHYGSSEAGSIANGYIDSNSRLDDLEFVLVKGAEHKILEGELLLKTEGMFSQYYNNPILTEQAFENGWFKTGDLVEFTSDRVFKIVGRKKDVIKKGGQQVVSSEVESFLQNIEGIVNVAVVGVPHHIYGEQVVAFVIAEGVTATDIRSYCSGRISSYKIPDKVIFIDDLPLTHGKVDKLKLIDQFMKG